MLVASSIAAVSAVSFGPGVAQAAGGKGGPCSVSGNPAEEPNAGAAIRAYQPFGKDVNPGFAGPGMSTVCRG